MDSQVYSLISEKLREEFRLSDRNLWQRDFFDVEPLPVYQVTSVVGNPPFIRFHHFNSETRSRALTVAAERGVRLTQLTSSWAPFVVHSISMLKPGGRLAMVVPMEIGHASYALPVLKHLQDSFRRVHFLTFKKKLFPTLSEDTLLLLAEDRGSSFSNFLHRDLANAGILTEMQAQKDYRPRGTQLMRAPALTSGRERLVEYLLPKKARELYRELKNLDLITTLGQLVDVGIGYVTGANDFFHLSPVDARLRRIPKKFLRAAVRRGRALSGLRFTHSDWQSASNVGEAGYLLSIDRDAELPETVAKYLDSGRVMKVPNGYKCRNRSPWYSVPHVYVPDAFLTYMSGGVPRLVTNDARVVAPNSLHVLKVHPNVPITAKSITSLWQTSLTRLSVEIEGHSLGGGMLKVEPGEAENCILAGADLHDRKLSDLATELDTLIRRGQDLAAQNRADTLILRERLGLSQNDCSLLKQAAETLMNRRCSRSTAL